MTSKEVGTFEKLLFADTFRGPHSTGVFARRELKIGVDTHISIPLFKKAVEGPEFLETQGWADTSRGFKDVADFPNFLVGHNRYATMGTINDINAHPFKVGDITLVHNGTLLDQSLLPNHIQFVVDSENVAHSINKLGAAETIQKLDGAFTLIWHDASDDTLHIIRNDERPFHLAQTTSGDWFGASEEAMLMWILERPRIPYTISRHFECKVGVEYVFDVDGGFRLEEEIEHKLPDFLNNYFSNIYGSGHYDNYGLDGRRSGRVDVAYFQGNQTQLPVVTSKKPTPIAARKQTRINDLLKSEGIKERLGEQLQFTAYDFNPYVTSDASSSGRVMGYIDHMAIYIEVQMHNVEEVMFRKHEDLIGIIVGAYEVSGVTTVVLRNLEDLEVKPALDNVVDFPKLEDGEEPEETRVGNGRTYTKESWYASGNDQCGNCSRQITFNEIDKDVVWFEQTPVCYDCEDIVNCILEGVSSPPPREGSFTCKNCKEDLLARKESTISDICKECFNWSENVNEFKDEKLD